MSLEEKADTPLQDQVEDLNSEQETHLPGFTYLHIAFLTMVLASASIQFAPGDLLFRLQPSFVGLTYIGFLVSLVLWLRQPQLPAWPWLLRLPLLVMLALWAIAVAVSLWKGSLFYFTAYTYPFFLLLVLLKPLSKTQVMRAISFLAWVLLVYLSVAYVLDVVVTMASDGSDAFRTDLGADRAWNPAHVLVGIEGRWVGPIGHPNTTAPIAAFLSVYSAARIRSRLPMFVISVYLLLASASTTSLLAAIAGISVLLFVCLLRRSNSLRLRAGLFLGFSLSAVGSLFVFLAVNPTLTGRTSIWPTYVQLGIEQRLLGSGDPPIAVYVAEGTLPPWAGHAHNVFLDVLVRYGLVALVLLVVVFVSLSISSVVSARRGSSLSLALLVTVLVVNLTELGIDFRYWEFGTVSAVVIALLAVHDDQNTADSDDSGNAVKITSA